MQKTLFALGALAALLALPGAHAAILSTSDITGAAAPMVPAEAAALAGPLPELYLADDGSLWQESNGVPGLQTAPVTDEAGAEIAPADTLVFGIPAVPQL